jgi:hypothetical protein
MKSVGSKASVYHGNAKHTSGGLTKSDLVRKSLGGGRFRIVSRRKSSQARRSRGATALAKWRKALVAARKSLGIHDEGFKAVKRGTRLYAETKRLYLKSGGGKKHKKSRRSHKKSRRSHKKSRRSHKRK